MKSSWIKAFKKDFSLNGVSDIYFWKSEWEKFDTHDYHDTKVSLYYVAYRFFYMAWFIGTYTETFICRAEDLHFYGIYLTNQTYTLQVIYSTLYFTYICWTFWSKRGRTKLHFNNNIGISSSSEELSSFHKDKYQLPLVCKLLWVMINMLSVVPYIVTVIYWLFLYDPHKEMETCAIFSNLVVHGLNSPLMLLDSFIMAVPIRRTHSFFAVVGAFYYILFSILYEVFNGRYTAEDDREYIYPMLNWRNDRGLAIGTAVGSFVGAFIIHFVMSYGIYRLRIYIKSKFSRYAVN